VLSGQAGLARLPGTAGRVVIREDLVRAGLLRGDEMSFESLYRTVATDVMPRDGDEMSRWGVDEWRPVLAYARELAR
jgi:hypothetical protein